MNKFTLVAAMATVSMMAWARPDSPSEFKMVFDFNGGNPIVKGSFICPTQHLSWEEPIPQIEKITKVKVTRGCYDLEEKDIVAYESAEEREPGSLVEFTDEFGELEYGYTYTYEVKIYDENGEESYGDTNRFFYGIKPGKPTITASLGEKGSLPVTLTVVAPTTTEQGDLLIVPLTKLRVVEYDGREIGTVNDPVPGRSYEVLDNGAEEGYEYTYQVYADCEYGTSEYEWVKAYVGQDAPGNPSNLILTENADGSVTLTWNAPEKGMKGGYFDPASVRYKVIRHGDSPKDLAEDLIECTYTDTLEGLTGPTIVKYEVAAYNAIGEDGYVMSSELLKGPAYQLPFEENFNAEVESYWGTELDANKKWTYESNGYSSNWDITESTWKMDATGVGDGDLSNYNLSNEEGFAFVNYGYAEPGDKDTMTSSAIDLTKASYPVVSFYCVAPASDPTTITVSVKCRGEVKDLLTVVPGEEHAEQIPVWSRHMAYLEEVAGNEVELIFTTQVPEDAEDYSYTGMGLDRIIIADYPGVENVSVADANGDLEVSWIAPKNSYDEEPDSYDVVVDDAGPVNVTEAKYVVKATRADEAESHKVSVRANYGDIQGKFSPVFDAVPGGSQSGINGISSSADVKVEYFDVNGLPVVKAMKGSTIIRRSVKADGSVKVEKIIVKE